MKKNIAIRAGFLASGLWFLAMWTATKAHNMPRDTGIEAWFGVFTVVISVASVAVAVFAVVNYLEME